MLPEIIYIEDSLEFPLDIGEALKIISEMGYQINGDARDIVDFLEKVALHIEEVWKTDLQQYFLNQLTATQYLYSNKSVRVFPHESDINQVWEENFTANPDTPCDTLGGIILADIEKEGPASLSRRAFGARRELTPRVRFYLYSNGTYYPLFAQRKEYIIRWDCFANTGKEAHLMKKALEKYFNIYQEKLYELGAQKFYVDDSAGPRSGNRTAQDKRTALRQRTLFLYLRLEEWYFGAGIKEITSIEMQWDTNRTIVIDTNTL